MTSTDAATGARLLRAILDTPADDDLRLIYADWLEDAGQQPRAEFIRVQVELQRAGWCPDHDRRPHDPNAYGIGCRHSSCRLRAWQLKIFCYDNQPLDWLRPEGWHVCRRGGGGQPCLGFAPNPMEHHRDKMLTMHIHRGFVALVHCPCQAWLDHGPALVARHPIEMVRLTDVSFSCQVTHHPDCPEEHRKTVSRWLWPWMVARGGYPADTEQDARDQESDDCLQWARHEADKQGLLP